MDSQWKKFKLDKVLGKKLPFSKCRIGFFGRREQDVYTFSFKDPHNYTPFLD
jgi:hypothetical protein